MNPILYIESHAPHDTATGPRAREGGRSQQSTGDFTRGSGVAPAREKREAAELAVDRPRAGPGTEHLLLRAQGTGGRGARLLRSRYQTVCAGGWGAHTRPALAEAKSLQRSGPAGARAPFPSFRGDCVRRA